MGTNRKAYLHLPFVYALESEDVHREYLVTVHPRRWGSYDTACSRTHWNGTTLQTSLN
jgi:hypothetical protein